MSSNEEKNRINWIQLVVNIIATSAICLGGLGVLANLKLAPIIQSVTQNTKDIEEQKQDIKDNRKVVESIHEISKNLAVLKNDFKHIKESVEKINE